MRGTAINEVIEERMRQVSEKGWVPGHDDQHDNHELDRAAICYIRGTSEDWPWGRESWKPSHHRRDLVKAAALIIAEIERLDRLPGGYD